MYSQMTDLLILFFCKPSRFFQSVQNMKNIILILVDFRKVKYLFRISEILS